MTLKRLVSSAAIVAAALAAATAVAAPPANDAGATTPARAASAAAAASATTASEADTEFLRQAAQDGQAEIEGARLALEKSRQPDVRAYAQRMVETHEAAQARLVSLARRLGVSLQDGVSLRQNAQMKLLSATDGTGFDRGFARQIAIGAHEHALMSYQRAAADGDDATIRSLASERLPVLQALIDEGRALERSTGLADREAAGGPAK